MNRRLITRADDFGSASSANGAILEALAAGYMVRNVSCMAPGKYIAQDAGELARYAGQVDLGLHFTLNSEWDSIKWVPCAPVDKIPSVLDKTGNFHQTSPALGAAGVSIEEVLLELDAQLDRLTAFGLPITYVDGHMFPERFIDGLDVEIQHWADRKGLICANDYMHLWKGSPEFAATEDGFFQNIREWLADIRIGTLRLYVSHPARYGPETLAFSNKDFPSGIVAHERELEYRSAISPKWCQWIRDLDLELVRFRDARFIL